MKGATLVTLRLDIPVRPQSLNAERMTHWAVHAALTKEAKDAAYIICLNEIAKSHLRLRGSTPYMDKVTIDVFPYAKDRRGKQDIGNCYPTAKACIDGLVRAGLIEDDDDTHLLALTFHPHQFGRDAMVLTVTEIVDD